MANRGKTAAMKRILVLLPVLILVLALGLGGCSDGKEEGYKTGSNERPSTPVPTQTPPPAKTEVDTPIFRNDEVCALVYNYLDNKATSMTDITQQKVTLFLLGEARPYSIANYQGKGKWQVLAVGIGEINWTYNGGLWNLYEASRAIEPANDQATKLLSYIQNFTITKIEGKETTPTTTPTPSPTAPPTSTPTPTPTPTPTWIMPERTAHIGGKQYPEPWASPVLTSSNWVVSYFETAGDLPTVPNSLLGLFRDVKAGDKLPLNTKISIPSSQFWNNLLPSERQTMLDIVEWYGMSAKDYLWWIAAMTPG